MSGANDPGPCTWTTAAFNLAQMSRLTYDEALALVAPLRGSPLPPQEMLPLLVTIMSPASPPATVGAALAAVARFFASSSPDGR